MVFKYRPVLFERHVGPLSHWLSKEHQILLGSLKFCPDVLTSLLDSEGSFFSEY